ncbi:MAG TPA: hypothetical protein VEV38_13250 [Candidatus Eremiobacteraceae bacterium]|nr:hypothetical protein [Candidatus Eremiobacteraceae bacterium]
MWEALAAVGSILSAIVIAVTVIFAARQVRVTVDQLEQVRKATQFEAARTVLLDLADPVFVDAYRFVASDLDKMMALPAFRRDIGLIGLADDKVHKEIHIIRAFDRIGTYVRFGLIDGEVVYTTYAPRIVLSYERLAEVIAIHRRIAGTQLYKNFDYLYEDCSRWLAANGGPLDVAGVTERIAEYQAQFPVTSSAAGAD